MQIGRKLATKLLNVSKFVLAFGEPRRGRGDRRADRPGHARPPRRRGRRGHDQRSTAYDYARALERTEAFFWWFCDDYVELVKGRAYGAHGDAAAGSAHAPRSASRSTRCSGCSRRSCRSSTEEVWCWWQEGSVHRAALAAAPTRSHRASPPTPRCSTP